MEIVQNYTKFREYKFVQNNSNIIYDKELLHKLVDKSWFSFESNYTVTKEMDQMSVNPICRDTRQDMQIKNSKKFKWMEFLDVFYNIRFKMNSFDKAIT